MADGRVVFEAVIDSTKAENDLKNLQKTVNDATDEGLVIEAEVDSKKANNDLKDLKKTVNQTAEEKIDIKADVDSKKADSEIKDLKNKVNETSAENIDIKADVDTTEAKQSLDGLKKKGKSTAEEVEKAIDKSTESSKKGVSGFVDTFFSAASSSSGACGSIVSSIAGIATGTGIAQIAVGLLDSALSTLGETFSSAVSRVDTLDTSTKSLTVLTGDAETAQGVMSDLSEAIQGTPIALDQVSGGAKKMVAAGMEASNVKDVFTAIADAAYGVGDGTQSIDQMTDAISSLQSSGTAYSDDINRLVDAGVPAWQMLANQTGMSVGDIKDYVSEGSLSSTDAINMLTQGIENGTTGIAGDTAKMQGLAQTAGDTISGSMSNMKTSFVRLIAEAITPFKDTFIGSMNGITQGVNGAISGLKTFNSCIQTFLQNSQAVQAFKGLIDSFSPVIKNLEDLALSFLTQAAPAFEPVKQAFLSFWNTLDPVLTQIFNLLSVVLPPAIEFTRTIVIEVCGYILNAVAPVFGGLLAGFGDVLTCISNTIGFVVALINGDWSGAMDFMWGAADSAKQFLEDIWNGILGTIDYIFPGIIDSITGFFSQLPEQMKTIGANVIQGFWDGVNGAKQWLEDKITELIGWLPDWIKKPLGIASPSKVMRDEVGKFIPLGIAEGIVQAMPSVKKTLTDQITSLADTASDVDIQTKTTNSVSINNDVKTNKKTGAKDNDSSVELKDLSGTVTDETQAVQTDINTAYPQMAQTADTYSNQMAKNVIQNVDTIQNPVNTALINTNSNVNTQTSLMSANATNNAVSMKTNMVTQTAQMATSTVSNADSLKSGVINTLSTMPTQLYSIGSTMMTQLNAGIDSTKQTVLDNTSDLVQKLLDTFITGLGIHSPSVKMQWIGEMMAAGIIKGLSSDKISKYTEHVIELMQDSFKNGKLDVNTVVDKLGDNIPDLIAKLGVDTSDVTSFLYPLLGTEGTISSYFGYRNDVEGVGSSYHQGLDIAAPAGTPIDAVMGGQVIVAGDYGGYGNAVLIDHGNGLQTLYGHMSQVGTSVGAQVGAGSVIGYVGSTGNSTGNHLHLSVIKDGEQIDPLPYVQGASISAGNTLASALMSAYYTKKYGTASTTSAGGDLTSWITQALQITGQLTPTNLSNTIALAQGESGGNPSAVNNWDSNAQAGHPSIGLMQTIQSTFDAYALPGHTNIYDPVDNAIASIRYQLATYGYLRSTPGYYKGTKSALAGLGLVGENGAELIDFSGGERVYNAAETSRIFNMAYANSQNAQALAQQGNVVYIYNAPEKQKPIEQNIYFQETPKTPSEYRAALKSEGRRLAFGKS